MLRPMAPIVTGIDNVHLYVSDMGRSTGFYRDVLGIPLEGDEHWQEAAFNGVRFALHEASASHPEHGSGGVALNFRVEDADDAAERVRSAGYDVREQMREEYGISFEVADPDGYLIYLFQPPA
jgi:lactoylglutathione lyase